MSEQMRLPDFLIGGAPRSGTTYLCHALDRHPDIYMAKPFIPEPKVFVVPVASAEAYRARYAELFKDAPAHCVLGEKTSSYLENEAACERIRRHLPGVRILFIVREPVARAYSNYLWSRKNGLETLSFEEAIELEGRRPSPLPPEKSYARPFDYLVRGNYDVFAQRWYDALGRDHVAFFLYEDIERREDRLLGGIQTFIGVDPLPFETLDAGVVNPAFHTGDPINPETFARLKQRMGPAVRRFAELTGLDIRAWDY